MLKNTQIQSVFFGSFKVEIILIIKKHLETALILFLIFFQIPYLYKK